MHVDGRCARGMTILSGTARARIALYGKYTCSYASGTLVRKSLPRGIAADTRKRAIMRALEDDFDTGMSVRRILTFAWRANDGITPHVARVRPLRLPRRRAPTQLAATCIHYYLRRVRIWWSYSPRSLRCVRVHERAPICKKCTKMWLTNCDYVKFYHIFGKMAAFAPAQRNKRREYGHQLRTRLGGNSPGAFACARAVRMRRFEKHSTSACSNGLRYGGFIKKK